MRYLFVLFLLTLLSGCSEEPRYADGKTLWNNKGCAFIVRHNVGDTVFLTHNKDLSLDSCDYKENIE